MTGVSAVTTTEYIFKGNWYQVNENDVITHTVGLNSFSRCYDEPKYFKAHRNFPYLTNFAITDAFKKEAKKCK